MIRIVRMHLIGVTVIIKTQNRFYREPNDSKDLNINVVCDLKIYGSYDGIKKKTLIITTEIMNLICE